MFRGQRGDLITAVTNPAFISCRAVVQHELLQTRMLRAYRAEGYCIEIERQNIVGQSGDLVFVVRHYKKPFAFLHR